jgi:hypothetical protein
VDQPVPNLRKDTEIYDAVFEIIEGVYWTDKIKGQNQDTDKVGEALVRPKTVDEAVEQILDDFPFLDLFETANMTERELWGRP